MSEKKFEKVEVINDELEIGSTARSGASAAW
jgi:hypothetical protein